MFVLPEVVLQRAIAAGIRSIKDDPTILNEIFCQYVVAEQLSPVYGQDYVDDIISFITETKIPVVQSFSFDASRVPSISIHLAGETEDESKASMGDYFGIGEEADIRVSAMTVNLDIGIHADKSKDHVLWLYYIVNYILYKEKLTLRGLGLQNITFNASDYNKESKYMAENVWTRWVRMRCTVQNYLSDEPLVEVDDVVSEITVESASQ